MISTLEPYRVLVTGSQEWTNVGLLNLALDHAYFEAAIMGLRFVMVNGKCWRGADSMALAWRRDMVALGFPVELESHPAYWKEYGKRAGILRNIEMVEYGADVCLAFIRNSSRGSTHCSSLAIGAGIETIIFREE